MTNETNDHTNAAPSARPRERIVRALFSTSRNKCAFPNCRIPAYDAATGSVLVEVRHIEGSRPDSARYRASQSVEERHGLGNLMLLCGVHHKVIDDDDVAYTVDRLKAMKAAHETTEEETPVPLGVAEQLLSNLAAGKIYAGSVIVSHHQMGGQTAHTIINNAPPARLLTETVSNRIVEGLRRHPPRVCELVRVDGDPEALRLAEQLKSALTQGGWRVNEIIAFAWSVRGMGLKMKQGTDAFAPEDISFLAKVLIDAGIMTERAVIADNNSPVLKVLVGHHP